MSICCGKKCVVRCLCCWHTLLGGVQCHDGMIAVERTCKIERAFEMPRRLRKDENNQIRNACRKCRVNKLNSTMTRNGCLHRLRNLRNNHRAFFVSSFRDPKIWANPDFPGHKMPTHSPTWFDSTRKSSLSNKI